MSPRSRLKQIDNVRRSSIGVGEILIRPDSVTLDHQTISDDEETLVGSSNESVIGSDESISDCSEWTSSGSEESFSDVDESRIWCDRVALAM